MRLLAWDTSAKAGALAAIEWQPGQSGFPRLVSEWHLDVDATHSERLLWAIDRILDACRWRLSDIDVFGVGVGPGSFTGLRIGITTARTLAHALQKPLVGVSSLAALARPAALEAASREEKITVVATIDACKGELFALWGTARSVVDCVVKADSDLPGLWKRGVDETVLVPTELMRAIKRKLGEGSRASVDQSRWMAVGEGRQRYLDAWKALPAAKRIEPALPHLDRIQGRYVAQLAWEGFQAGIARPALEVFPRYVRAPDAELKLKAGLLGKRA